MPNQFDNNNKSSQKENKNTKSSYPNNEYETEFASENAGFNLPSNGASIASGASISKNSNASSSFANEEYATEIAPQIVDFNRSSNNDASSSSTMSSNTTSSTKMSDSNQGSSSKANSSSKSTSGSDAGFANEEYAAEVAPNIIDFNRRDNGNTNKEQNTSEVNNSTNNNGMVDGVTSGKGIGGLALVLSILSLFVLPIVLGAAGIIIGFIARRRGATKLGSWAIGIGAISIIVGMFVLPFF